MRGWGRGRESVTTVAGRDRVYDGGLMFAADIKVTVNVPLISRENVLNMKRKTIQPADRYRALR